MYPSFEKGNNTQTFPEEINEEILTRLPIKSLVRFLSVSKPWLSLISDPRFVKAQLNRSINRNPNYHDNLVALNCNGVGIISRYKETRNYQLPFLVHDLLGSINGLVCVYRLENFWLWNPAINKFKEFTPVENKNLYMKAKKDSAYKNLYRKTKIDSAYTRLLGFGWDHLRNDFKVVSCYLSPWLRKCVVYSSSSDSWTKLVFSDFVFPEYFFTNMRIELTPATIVNNCPYWRYSNYFSQIRDKWPVLIKFDVETNEFRFLPDFDYATGKQGCLDFVNINDCLAAMVYRAGPEISLVDVYTLNEVSGVWNKMYTVGPIKFGLSIWSFLQGFKYGGEIVFDEEGKIFYYDPKTGVVIGVLDSSNFLVNSCFSYTPTMVFLPGMKTVKFLDGK